MWLKSQFRGGPNMIAIMVTMRIQYECNANTQSDIFGPYWKIAIIIWSHCDHQCSHIWFLFWSRLQSYLVPFGYTNRIISKSKDRILYTILGVLALEKPEIWTVLSIELWQGIYWPLESRNIWNSIETTKSINRVTPLRFQNKSYKGIFTAVRRALTTPGSPDATCIGLWIQPKMTSEVS